MADLTSSMARQVLGAAAAGVSDVVRLLPPGATDEVWSRPTPCADWDLRTLLNHLTVEHLWVPRLLAAETLAEVGDDYDGDMLGSDPPAAWEDAITRSLLAWAQVDDETVPIQMSFGPVTRHEYAQQMVVDLVVHGWDLARAAGLPYDPSPAAVQEALDYERPRLEGGQGWPGIFGQALPAPEDSTDLLDEALALTGRDPRWGR
ncbi:TIGR03086 family metal-binding protein [Ornithinimicrobium pratense]|uniref:TIGR03086 family protein n=1 Tax=Ornithinimicrobium pratense TaxID=2593973 RepID=A0A5J6V8F5_9MICO|nr:TIGR03086 family metal-binding protein [Ornithinimicrobium pratense]QFG69624.1 TIGR03086 family protein [Ornithinimicrobium pratense]